MTRTATEKGQKPRITKPLTPEQRERKNELQRARRANDPEYRERDRTYAREYARRARANDPEYRERERARKNDPEYRDRMRAQARERYANDPEYRERQNANSRERYTNLSGVEYNREQLRKRRNSALRRRAERDQRRQEVMS